MQSQPLPVTPREIADARRVITDPALAAQLPETIRALVARTAGFGARKRPGFRAKTTRGDA